MGADLRISVFDLDRCGPCWTPFYRPYGPATAPLCWFCGFQVVAIHWGDRNGIADRSVSTLEV